MRTSNEILAYAAILLGVFGHATSEFVAVQTGVSGPEQSVWRFMLGGLGLIVVALAMADSRDLLTPLRERPVEIVLLSVFGMALAQLLFHWSLDFASVTQIATLVTISPILVVIFNWLLFKGQISTPKIVSGVGAFGGVVFLMTDGYLAELAGRSGAIYGILLALSCATIGAFYMVLVRPLILQYGAIRMTTYTFAIGAVGLWLAVAGIWGIVVNPATLFERPVGEAVAILAMGFWNTTIAMVLWLWGLSAAKDIGRANYTFFFKPVIAAFLAYFILGQDITLIQLLAIAVICGCVLVEVFWDQLFGKPFSATAHGD
ncbi:MAG: DMT family transporter [Pseudomonadota bacterium]